MSERVAYRSLLIFLWLLSLYQDKESNKCRSAGSAGGWAKPRGFERKSKLKIRFLNMNIHILMAINSPSMGELVPTIRKSWR